jgi:hypothetical protein
MKKLPALLLVFTFTAALLSGCEPLKKKCSRGYDLEHPVSVYPIKESYNIGDTLWFEMNFSDVFNALVTNNYTGTKFYENIQLKNFDFRRTFLSFVELADSSENVAGQSKSKWDESFDPSYITGNILQELPDGPEYKLIYQNNSYLLKIGMILKKSGVFLYNPVFFHNYLMADFGYLNEQDLTPECETEIITAIHFPVNKQPDGSYLTNFHLFEQFMNPSLENDLDRIQKECFTFVVL